MGCTGESAVAINPGEQILFHEETFSVKTDPETTLKWISSSEAGLFYVP